MEPLVFLWLRSTICQGRKLLDLRSGFDRNQFRTNFGSFGFGFVILKNLNQFGTRFIQIFQTAPVANWSKNKAISVPNLK